ncbi:MAG: hypothetical protein EKK61_00775 [Rickettsiales bacterium]|nr:MAG: hypothetical protein EKK61_00775 [Rickettsiales bacterium]
MPYMTKKQKLDDETKKKTIPLSTKIYTTDIVEFLSSPDDYDSLGLSNPSISNDHLTNFCSILKNNIKLVELFLDNIDIGNEGALAIANSLQENLALSKIKFNNNKINYNGAKAIAKALEENTTLTILDFSFNEIGDEGLEAFAKALKKNTTLTNLRLANNNVIYKKLEAFAKALEKNTTLTILDFSFNNIGDEGAIYIAEALEVNKKLTKLYLSCNNIGDEGLKAFTKASQKNTTLTVLDLSFNNMSDVEILNALYALCSKQSKLNICFVNNIKQQNETPTKDYILKKILLLQQANAYISDGGNSVVDNKELLLSFAQELKKNINLDIVCFSFNNNDVEAVNELFALLGNPDMLNYRYNKTLLENDSSTASQNLGSLVDRPLTDEAVKDEFIEMIGETPSD